MGNEKINFVASEMPNYTKPLQLIKKLHKFENNNSEVDSKLISNIGTF